MKAEVSAQAKTLDCQIQRLQSLVLDSVAQLTSIVEVNSKGETVSHKQAVNIATAAIELVGNASIQMSHYKRTRIITSMNKTLLPLVEDDKNFKDAAPVWNETYTSQHNTYQVLRTQQPSLSLSLLRTEQTGN